MAAVGPDRVTIGLPARLPATCCQSLSIVSARYWGSKRRSRFKLRPRLLHDNMDHATSRNICNICRRDV